MRDEIQAYLDAHNLFEDCRTADGQRVNMVDGLHEIDGVFFYVYDGLSSTGIRPGIDGRVTVYYECCDPHEQMREGQVEETTLAQHFYDLRKILWEYELGEAQAEYVESCGGKVTNSGWSVEIMDDRVEYCSKTTCGRITSVRVWATGAVSHEWL